MVEYHSTDFDLETWKEKALQLYPLPPLSPWISPSAAEENICAVGEEIEEFSEKWNTFYSKHKSGDFFKPRRYLTVEFHKYLSQCGHGSMVLEVGCGHGCSMYPIIENFPVEYIATDYSAQVICMLKRGTRFPDSRAIAERWDVTLSAPPRVVQHITAPLRAVVSVFALSAVHPDLHVKCFENMRHLLQQYGHVNAADAAVSTMQKTGTAIDTTEPHEAIPPLPPTSSAPAGVILFRDYGIHDMTMHRHKRRFSDTLFERADGTLAYYFDLLYLRDVAEAAGLTVLELEYATVRTENRKQGSVMHRVFVHAVFSA